MAYATTLASLYIFCVRQNFAGSSTLKLDSAWISMAFITLARMGVSYSSKKSGFLNISEFETRLALLHAVVPQSEFLARKSSIEVFGHTFCFDFSVSIGLIALLMVYSVYLLFEAFM
jgi:hypothetical protein